MNYSFIDSERPLPSIFKPIGISIGLISLFIGIYLKLSGAESLFEVSIRGFQLIYFSAFIMIQFSKAKIEDERTEELRLQIMRLGYRMMLLLILLFAIASTNEEGFRFDFFFNYVISIIGFQIIINALLDYNKGMDLFIANKSLYIVSSICVLIALIFFNQWVWLS